MNLPITDTEIIEANQEEYEEQQAVLKEMAVIAAAQAALEEQYKAKQPKFARVAREYLPALRNIFWRGHCKDEAQELIQELTLESTVPLSELELAFGYIGDQYQQVDSYVGETLDTLPVSAAASQWDMDYEEVQEVLRVTDEIESRLVPEADPEAVEPLVMVAVQPRSPQPGETEAQVVVSREESLTARIVQEMKSLGYSEQDIEQALSAQFAYDEPEEDEPAWERDVRIGGPVEAMAADRPDFESVPEAKRSIRRYLKLQDKILELNDWLRRHPDGVYYEREVFIQKLKNRGKIGFFRKLQNEAVGDIQPQTLAMAVFTDRTGEFESRASEIRIAVYGTLENFIDLFGDDILEETVFGQEERGYWNTPQGLEEIEIAPCDDLWTDADPRIDRLAAETIREIIEKQFAPDPTSGGKPDIENSRAFARGVFASVAAGESQVKQAGYANWRREKSPRGAIAYKRAMEENQSKPWAERLKLAMRAFWNTGKVVGVSPGGLEILKEANGEKDKVNWNLAAWKIKHGEIFLTAEERQRLKGILAQRKWGYRLLSLL